MNLQAWTIPLMIALTMAPAPARADELGARVMVLPVEGEAPAGLGALSTDVAGALARGAARTTSTVARATASLSDTAVIVGCDPSLPACRDAVAAALNVDQLLLARIELDGTDASVEVTAVTREGEPVVQRFAVRVASRAADLAALERQVPIMLEAGEARRDQDVGGTKTDTGTGTGKEPGTETGTDTGTGTGTGMSTGTGTGTSTSTSTTGPLLVASAGAVMIALGGVSWGLAAARQGDIDEAPTETAAQLERLASLERAAGTRALLGNVLVVGGVLTVAAGASWWLWNRRAQPDDDRLSVGPAVFVRGAGLAVRGRW